MVPFLLPGGRLRCSHCGLDHFGQHIEDVCDNGLATLLSEALHSLPDRTEIARRQRVALRPWLN